MTKGEFISQFHLLCKGFRYEATAEQTDAWYRKVQQHDLQDWTDAVSTLLCGARFPLLDPALAALDAAREHRTRVAVWKDKKDAERVTQRLERGEGTALSPDLFATIRTFSARQQVRHALMQVAGNVGDRWEGERRERELARLREEEARLTEEYERLIMRLPQAEAASFSLRYGREIAA